MNGLRDFGLSGELSKGEFERKLSSKSPDEVKELRRELFEEAVMKGLTEEGDMLVMRRKVGVGKSVKNKHVEDVWSLVGTIQRCELGCPKGSAEKWQTVQKGPGAEPGEGAATQACCAEYECWR